MNGDGVSTCIHCGRRVVRTTMAVEAGLEETWVHQNTGLMLCEQTVATPALTETPAALTGQVPFPETSYRVSTYDNRANLDPDFLAELERGSE